MNGYEAIALIKDKTETKDIPVIFLTASSDSESELRGLSLGAVDYIIKPFSLPLLRKRIELHLLIEEQKKELIVYNNDLQGLVDAKTKTVVELQNAILKTMAELVEFRDNITGGHIERTQGYLRILVNEVMKNGLFEEEISSWDLELIMQSAQLHDVGKIGIQDSILQKPGKLTEEEYEKIKEHTTFGEKVIDRIKSNTVEQTFLDYAKILALTHHEKWDGSGYPGGLKGKEIPLLGRLMAIADVYDALVSHRSYKNAFTHEEAVKIIEDGKAKHFDPILVDLFLTISGKFDEITHHYKTTKPAEFL
jgi:putative two-component system response regulator